MAANEAKMDFGVEDLKDNMISLFEHRESADLTIVCGSYPFKIHSFILCPRSTFFQAAFEGGFKEGLAKRIDLPEQNPHLICELIWYCYATDYSVNEDTFIDMEPEHAFVSALHFHAGMYAMAGKFDLKNLKKLAEKKFVIALAVLEPSIRMGGETFSQLLKVKDFIYSTTPENDRSLRDLVVGYVAKHWYAFLGLQQFKTFIAANTDFIIEVIEAKELVCSRCGAYAAWKRECGSLGPNNSNDGW